MCLAGAGFSLVPETRVHITNLLGAFMPLSLIDLQKVLRSGTLNRGRDIC